MPFWQRTPNLEGFISYRISAIFFGFWIWQKSLSTISKVILKDFFCKNFFHYGNRETVVAERLKTQDLIKIVDIEKNLKNGWRQSLVRSLPSRNKTLVLVIKYYAKTDIKVFSSCPILLNFLVIFCKKNSFMTEVPIIKKPMQINGLVSI